ncbi:MAG TPA: DAK2 domain-containing protein [Candidatus Dormibacteraeota bacterium]|nr:DAK2 domain-containing protein [Candidatus Dormibacteraeota bacterium]
MSAPGLRMRVTAAADAVEASRDELCRLDAGAGDGDHGVTMALAARAVRKALDSSPEAPAPELVTKLALAMGSVGGAIGPIYATGLLAIAGSLRGVAAGAPFTVEGALRCAEAADAAIAGLGNAKPGDKTILDALNPAVEALRAAHASDASIDEALDAAARAAHEGAESTAAMIAAVGRASRLGERSRGLADPGASSFALIMDALAARA